MPNQLSLARLYAALQKGRLPHAVLLTGAEGGDFQSAAERAAMFHLNLPDAESLAQCPDYLLLGPNTPVESVRNLRAELAARSVSGRRAVVILEAHTMLEPAQNALLKTLEEPPRNTLLLLAGRETGLLPTIRSRCAIVRLGAEPEEELAAALIRQGADPDAARLAARLSDGASLLAAELLSDAHLKFYPQAANLFFEALSAPVPPYAAGAALLNAVVAPKARKADFISPYAAQPEKKRSAAEEKRLTLRYCLRIFADLSDTLLRCKLDLDVPGDAKTAQKLRETARRFTISRIQGIMNLVLSAQVRAMTAASPALTLDALLTELNAPAGEQPIL